MKILAIDSSGLTATVAVSEDDRLVASYDIQYKTTHSQILMPMLEDIRNKVDLDMKSIDAVAVAAGPGSFTGLRIGAAAAKGLCLALDKPLIAIPTIDAMAWNLYGTRQIICPMMDARRSQVYTGIYTFVPEKNEENNEIIFRMKTIVPQRACSIEEIAEKLNELGESAILLGDGVPVYKDKLAVLLKIPYAQAPLHQSRQRAASLCSLGAVYFREGRITDADSFAPEYLRPSQAERQAGELRTAAPKVKERVLIRPLKAEDMDAAASLEAANLGKEAWTEKQLITANARDDTVYLVAEKQGAIVGLCGLQNISGDGEITNVSVAASSRGEGIAYKMLKQLLERGKGIGAERFTLEVRSANAPARALYEKLGFKSEGTRPGFYADPADDAEIYWKR
ncbi:bifunctional tRNA (adenosine(37)-N6)-threonylcarbamoyltransferase complex dimerization subunit type 1 TsaB/ribosomal protein alanine acetyltransferase RimI [Butyrivibrio sp. MC2013]|uniref:bifunctional tRNA (adenosine(37)-N6)-threonylcarbamoyltransferase complex dimerization subunit type 1 TsaB/ribosomal protein alanine acetyltransferase RimI n=1 Tax=Butyrivibrio sp. MC2013 TaxID=1280686 RepID=UPI00041EA895|nr:bifunctional tRNA (adenosine(37)-N6)-threonylcarbamoyltransferase complex dimerization subunit type 1 TsaB/ribosomal protein alanine acetyltransferase RimI [Butyrivibrio sp. MC2013]